MTTYSVHMDNVQAVAQEMGMIGSRVQGLIDELNSTCDASVQEWQSSARAAYEVYKGQWTTAANNMPVQAVAAQNALSEITDAYALAEYQGLGLWEQ